MKKSVLLILACLAFTAFMPAAHAVVGFGNQKFIKQFYFESGGKGSKTGLDASNAKDIADGDIMAIPAGTVIEKVYVIIKTALTGSTALEIGDDDDSAGFCPNASLTLGSAGMYCYSAKMAGSYLRTETAGASYPLDIDVVPNSKYYSATGKEIKLNNTTTNTAGKFVVVVEGFRI